MFLRREEYNRSDWFTVDLTGLSGLITRVGNFLVQLAALQLIIEATNGLPRITRGGSRILFFWKEIKVCIVSVFVWPFVFEDSSKYPLFSVARK